MSFLESEIGPWAIAKTKLKKTKSKEILIFILNSSKKIFQDYKNVFNDS